MVSKYLLIKGMSLCTAMNEQISCINFRYFKYVTDSKMIPFAFFILIQKIIDFFFLNTYPHSIDPEYLDMRVLLPSLLALPFMPRSWGI